MPTPKPTSPTPVVDIITNGIKLCHGAGNGKTSACWMSAINLMMGTSKPTYQLDRPPAVACAVGNFCMSVNDKFSSSDKRSAAITPHIFAPVNVDVDKITMKHAKACFKRVNEWIQKHNPADPLLAVPPRRGSTAEHRLRFGVEVMNKLACQVDCVPDDEALIELLQIVVEEIFNPQSLGEVIEVNRKDLDHVLTKIGTTKEPVKYAPPQPKIKYKRAADVVPEPIQLAISS